jgi:AcrR family transcriptional regulator
LAEGARSARAARPGKRERLVTAARELLYRKGIAGTSLADIAQAADVPVGNVYYYFKTKNDIVGAVVQTYEDQLHSVIAEVERRHDGPEARLEAFLATLTERAVAAAARYGPQYGCPYGTLSSELAMRAEGPDPLAAKLMRIQVDWTEQQLRAAGRSDARGLAIELIAAYQGAAVLTSTLGDAALLTGQTDRLRQRIAELGTRRPVSPPPA